MLNSKKKSIRKEIENSPDTLKSKKRLLDLYLAKTTLIFNIFKNAYQILIQHKISKKIMYSIKFFKYFFFWGGALWWFLRYYTVNSQPYGRFWNYFYCNIVIKGNCSKPRMDGWLNSNINHPQFTFNDKIILVYF